MNAILSQSLQTIPLSQLTACGDNVRRTNREEGIDELAASIAAHGLLQNLTVRPLPVKGKGRKVAPGYGVLAGGRRLAALQRLAAEGVIAADAPIPCQVLDEGIPAEISLAENALQCPMHPADQYEAFAALHRSHGLSADDIASRFGVSPVLVHQRLKLGAVSPALMAAYRAGEMSLDQLSAFTLTEDHTRQEDVWARLTPWDNGRAAILRALAPGDIPAHDRRAVFVGVAAYEAAGGTVIRDLFDEEGGFFTDGALLDRLVREKLQAAADGIAAEGWKWVSVTPDYDYAATSRMKRVTPETALHTPEEEARLEELNARLEAIASAYDGDLTDEENAEFDAIEAEIAALEGKTEYLPEDIARAGAFVSLGSRGELRIERGFLRAEDGEGERESVAAKPARRSGLPDRVVADLTAHRSTALRLELAANPNLTSRCLAHALAGALFYSHADVPSCLRITGRSEAMERHAPTLEMSATYRSFATLGAAWRERLPEDVADLWGFVIGLTPEELAGFVAYCAAMTIDAVRLPHTRQEGALRHADELAEALALDMARHWQPTVAGYFGKVSKALILEAVAEGVSKPAAVNLSTLKKTAMAEAAEKRLAGTGWLPEVLRMPTGSITEANAAKVSEVEVA